MTPEPAASSVSVVIVTYNGRPYLTALRDALRPQVLSADEVVVFDNGSTDGTPRWLREEWREARVIESPHNLLFAAGNNEATRHTHGDVVLYLNQDTVSSPSLLDAARRTTLPRQAVTYGQLFPWASTVQLPFIDWSGVVLWRVPDEALETVNMLSGAAFSLHRDTLGLIGHVPFDPRIPHNCEDTHLSLRLETMGVRLVGLRDDFVRHDSTPSKGHAIKDFFRAIEIGRNRILAHVYALGTAQTLKRLPYLMLAGYRKAGVDGRRTSTRIVGITLASWIGYALAMVKRPQPRR